MIWFMVMCGGATPFIVNSSRPNGGLQQAELHADQEHHAEPDRIDAQL